MITTVVCNDPTAAAVFCLIIPFSLLTAATDDVEWNVQPCIYPAVDAQTAARSDETRKHTQTVVLVCVMNKINVRAKNLIRTAVRVVCGRHFQQTVDWASLSTTTCHHSILLLLLFVVPLDHRLNRE